jgi:hypothetical protein
LRASAFLKGIGYLWSLDIGFGILHSSFELKEGAKALSEIHRVSKTAVWKWIRKLGERLNVNPLGYLGGS